MKKILELIRKAFFPNVSSKKWHTDARDYVQAVFRAALTTPLTIIVQSLEAGHLVFDWRALATVALTGGLLYIVRSLISGK